MNQMERQSDVGSVTWGALARRGAIGGLVGGIALAMLMMIVTAAKGMGLLRPLYLIAATFHGSWAMAKGVDIVPLVIGLMVHMLNSIIFGVVFALLLGSVTGTRRWGATAWTVSGLVWGLIVFIVNQYVVLPAVDPAMAMGADKVLFWWVLGHMMFGLILGFIVGSQAGVRSVAPVAARQPL